MQQMFGIKKWCVHKATISQHDKMQLGIQCFHHTFSSTAEEKKLMKLATLAYDSNFFF